MGPSEINIRINIGILKVIIYLQSMLPNHIDGPSNTLLKVIEEDKKNLSKWKGYRELTEK